MPVMSFSNLRSLACVSTLLLANSAAQAATTCAAYNPTGTEICLEDGNAIFVVDTLNAVQAMNVDDVNHIFFQDFLYDYTVSGNGSGPEGDFEQGVDSYGSTLTNTSLTGTNQVSLTYSSSKTPTIQLDFTLTGGALGSDTATIVETFTFTNTEPSELIRMFAYTDVDLGGAFDSTDDSGELNSTTSYRQFDDTWQILASTDVAVDNYMVGIADTVIGQLYDDTDTIYPNTPAVGGSVGPGDLQMVAQWNRTLATNATFSYTQTLALSPVSEIPVPAAVWLFGSGLIALYGAARRRAA